LFQVEHVPVGIDELGEPLAPLHLLGRHRELDAGAPESLVVFLDVVRDERDARRTRFGRPPHVAQVDAGPRAARTDLDPVARIVGGALDARVRVGLARADVHDVQTEHVAVPRDGLHRIGDDDCNRVDAEDRHSNPVGIRVRVMNLRVGARH